MANHTGKGNTASKYAGFIEVLKKHPGEWAAFPLRSSKPTRLAGQLQSPDHKHYPAFLPREDFEVAVIQHDSGVSEVQIRFIGKER
jgi:hypothetical protein